MHSQHRNAAQMRRSTATHYPIPLNIIELLSTFTKLGAAFTWERILFYNKHESYYEFTNSSLHDVVYAEPLGAGDFELVGVKLGLPYPFTNYWKSIITRRKGRDDKLNGVPRIRANRSQFLLQDLTSLVIAAVPQPPGQASQRYAVSGRSASPVEISFFRQKPKYQHYSYCGRTCAIQAATICNAFNKQKAQTMREQREEPDNGVDSTRNILQSLK
ncbi:hypothetical protein BDR04DRAFT_1144220 [Suillus decipiens]|nr:hypothetical protein BDR04DRAFT_1144220 [Suillus decipiens]